MKLKSCCKAVDITPPEGVRLAGYPHFPRENTGAHDPLYATAFYFSDGTNEVALVTLDILFFSRKYADRIRDDIETKYGISKKNLTFTCSHTHSGPWAAGNPELEATAGDSEDIDPDYLEWMLASVVELVGECKAEAYPASVGYGKVRCGAEYGIGGNRRDPEGICDPYLSLLSVKDEAGKVRGVLTSYALHPTFLHEDSTLVTSDYPHYLRKTVKDAHPEAVLGFAQGTSGDQSSRYFRQGQSFDEAERVGGTMGRLALELIDSLEYTDEIKVDADEVEVELILREYPPVEELEARVERKRAEYEEIKANGGSYLDVQNANLRMLGAEDMLGYAICLRDGRKIDLLDDEIPAKIGVVRLGGLAIAHLPGELFVEYGLKIKEESSAECTFVFELTNGCLPGYCCNDEALASETYEAGNSMLSPEFGIRCADILSDMTKKLFGRS